jgi:hypothetical protein
MFRSIMKKDDTKTEIKRTKSVSIEGRRIGSRSGKSFGKMDQKNQLQIKRIIQSAITDKKTCLDLSEKDILSLNSQIGDLNNCLKVLHLQKNRIQTLPSEIGCLRNGLK